MIEKPSADFLIGRLNEMESGAHSQTADHLRTLAEHGPDAQLLGFKTGRTTARAIYFLVTSKLPEAYGKDEVNAVVLVAERLLRNQHECLSRAIERR